MSSTAWNTPFLFFNNKKNKTQWDVKRLLHTVGEGEGGMIGENRTETYTLPYVK